MNEIIEIDWVRHARSCSNDGSLLEKIMQPPITYLGILQSFKLSTNVFDKNFNYNEIYSSASVRTIMTALFALREQNYSLLKTTGKKLKIIIVPYINEDTNPAAYVGAIDNQNIILNTEQISNVINYIKSWMIGEYFESFDDPILRRELLDIQKGLDLTIEEYKAMNEIIIKILEYEKYILKPSNTKVAADTKVDDVKPNYGYELIDDDFEIIYNIAYLFCV